MPNYEVTDFRRPSDYEVQRVSACIELSNNTSIRRNKRIKMFFMAMGISMILASGTQDFPLVVIAIGFIFLGSGLLCIISNKTRTLENKAVKKGDFYVRDGYISKLEANTTTTGCLNATFTSVEGTFTDGVYMVRGEQVSEGTSALLVYVFYDPSKPPRRYIFTPFMLTDEGIRLHW